MNVDTEIAVASQVSRGRLVRNAIASYVNFGLAVILGLFLQAFVVRRIGRAEYAVWPLVLTCVGVLDLLPVGVGAGAGRFLAHALAREAREELAQITTSLFAGMSVVALAYAITGFFVSRCFEGIFSIPQGAEGTGPRVMLIMTLSGAISMPFSVFGGGLIAAQRYVALNALRSAQLLVRVALIVALFLCGRANLITLASVNCAVGILHGLCLFLLARWLVPWQQVRVGAFRWKTIRKLASYGGFSLVTAAAGLLYWKTDNVVINKLLEPELLTGYAVVAGIVLQVYNLTWKGSTVLLPAATVLHAKGDIARMARMVYRANCLLVPLAAPGLVFLMLYGDEVLSLYVGPQYRAFSSCLGVLAAAMLVSCTQATSGSIPQAFGRLRFVTFLAVTWALLNVALSVVLVTRCHLGVLGVALGTCVVVILGRGIVQPAYIAWLLRQNFCLYYWRSVLRPLLVCVPVTVAMLSARSLGLGSGWKQLASVAILSWAIVHVPFVLWIGIEKPDRDAAIATLRRTWRHMVRQSS